MEDVEDVEDKACGRFRGSTLVTFKARGEIESPFQDLQSQTLPLCYLAEIL